MRRTLLSAVVCIASAGAIGAGGWSLQAVALPPPARAARIAADASAWLHYYHYSIDVFHTHGGRLHGTCLRGWYPRQHTSRLARGSLLVLDGQTVVLDTGGRQNVRFLSGRHRRDLPGFLAVAAGCTSSLGSDLYAALQRNMHLSIERAFAAHQPALALHVPHVHGERLTLYVSPRRYRPLEAVATVGGHVARARIYLARATPGRRSRDRRLLADGVGRRA